MYQFIIVYKIWEIWLNSCNEIWLSDVSLQQPLERWKKRRKNEKFYQSMLQCLFGLFSNVAIGLNIIKILIFIIISSHDIIYIYPHVQNYIILVPSESSDKL
jgi:hypothetical protein